MTASSTSYSEPSATPTPVERARLAKGAAAPFAGVLLSDAALAKIITDYEAKLAAEKLLREKAEREAKTLLAAEQAACKIKLDGEARKLAIAEAGCARERVICDKALTKTTSSAWYQSPYLHNFLGCVACGGICAGAVAASRR